MKAIMRLCARCGRRYKPHARGRCACPRSTGKCPCCGERIPWLRVDRDMAREVTELEAGA